MEYRFKYIDTSIDLNGKTKEIMNEIRQAYRDKRKNKIMEYISENCYGVFDIEDMLEKSMNEISHLENLSIDVLNIAQAKDVIKVNIRWEKAVADTSGEIQPPGGLFAPQGGFGLIWRGDVSNTEYFEENFREVMGWALGPESYYEATYQCNRIPSGCAITHARCHMLDPDGRLITFHPNGGWYQAEP